MTESYWPKEGYLEPYKYQPEDRMVIQLNERFRIIEERITKLESKK